MDLKKVFNGIKEIQEKINALDKQEVEPKLEELKLKLGTLLKLVNTETLVKNSNLKLKGSEERFRRLFEDSGDASLIIRDNKFIDCNKATLKMFRMETKEEVFNTHPSGLSPKYQPDNNLSREKAEEMMLIAFSAGNHRFEWVHKRADGELFDAEVLLTRIEDKEKNLLHCVCREISERKETERELIKSEERFRKLFEDSADATLLIENNKFVDCNKATLEMLHMESKEQLINTHPSVLSPKYQPDERLSLEKAEEMMKTAFEKGSHRFEWIHKKSDGELFYAEVLLTKIEHKNKNLLHCVWRDITERKEAEKALKASEESYKFLFEQAADGIIICDIDGNIQKSNKSISKITGYKEPELLGKNMRDLFPVMELKKNPLRYDLIRSGKTILKQRELKMKDGTIIIIEMNTKLLDDGRLQSYIRDITERRKHEKQIIAKNIELQKTRDKLKETNSNLVILNKVLEKQKEELRRAKDKAEESDRLKSAFLANMSHEIRTPMNGILGFAQLLKEPKLTNERQDQYLNIINQSGVQMLDIINDLVDISKIEAGQMDVFVERTDINRVVKRLFVFFQPESEVKNISLEYHCDLPDSDSIIEVDKTKFQQILTNLIKNAVKFTTRGGKVKFGYLKKNNALEFYVSDTGMGIPVEFRNHVFKRFHQARDSITSNYGGSGLGLSICRAFVKMHGGKIWFDTEIDKGTTFYFTIPLNKN